MQVEQVARICFPPWWTAQQQRNLAVRPCMFREVVIHHQRILPVLHKLFAHRTTRIGSDILQHRRFISRSDNHRSVFHCSMLFECCHSSSNGSLFLSNCHINTKQILPFLIDDRINSNRRFTGLPVANDQFPLSTTDRNHRVDRLQTRLDRHVDVLTRHHTGSNTFNGTVVCNF